MLSIVPEQHLNACVAGWLQRHNLHRMCGHLWHTGPTLQQMKLSAVQMRHFSPCRGAQFAWMKKNKTALLRRAHSICLPTLATFELLHAAANTV